MLAIIPKKKQKIPATLRNAVWKTYVGTDTNEGKCFCCNIETISSANFECGHVVAESKGGLNTLQNLRPLCGLCNKSMGAKRMDVFMEQCGFAKNKIETDNMPQLEKYVRRKLGQNFDEPSFDYDECGRGKPIHKRFDFSAHNCHKVCDCHDNIYTNNREICEIFECDVYPYKIVVYVWKGILVGYLVLSNKYCDDYWDEKNWNNGVNGKLDMPYAYKKEYSGAGTVQIIIDLILQARLL